MDLAPHRVAAVVVPPVLGFDVSIPLMVFNSVPFYDVRVCTARPGPMPTVGGPDIVVPDGLDAVEGADTVIAVGSGGEEAPREALDALRKAAAGGARIASLCTGAFVLAQAGLLDGLRATTHWGLAGDLATRFPSVDVQPDLLFVEDGGVFTSAGAAAAIDLCLHLVAVDYGAAVANSAARLAVVPPVRPGGQSQFIETPLPPERGSWLAPTRAWALEHLDRPLTLADLAGHARTSVRTLSRLLPRGDGAEPAPVVAAPARRPGQGAAGDHRAAHGPGGPREWSGERGLPPQAHGRPLRTDPHGVPRELQQSGCRVVERLDAAQALRSHAR